ncbi:hypothetical protein D9M72_395550 [compost metagenome]
MPLGLVQRHVGVHEQLADGHGLAPFMQRRTDAGRGRQRMPVDHQRHARGLHDGVGNGIHRAAVGDPVEDHRELIAADARDRVALAHAGTQALRERHQQAVADRMAVVVVDRLEVVQVHQQQCQRAAAGTGACHAFRQAPVEALAVKQAGEMV